MRKQMFYAEAYGKTLTGLYVYTDEELDPTGTLVEIGKFETEAEAERELLNQLKNGKFADYTVAD